MTTSTTTSNTPTTYTVKSISDLQSTLKKASRGDTIILANNTYVTDAKIVIATNGVTIVAQTLGGVKFRGDAVTFVITGNDNVLSGFQFMYGAPACPTRPMDLIQIRGSRNIIDNMNFDGFYVEHTINIYAPSQYNWIRNCNFQKKPVDTAINGSQIEIQADANMLGGHKVSYCTFQQMLGNGGDFGNEPIRLGEGSMSSYDLGAIVEYCVFDNTQLADSEVISVKSRKNIIRYNTFRNNPNATVTFRNGDFNIAYGNYFLGGSSGIKIKQASNIYIYNNMFVNCPEPLSFIDVSSYPNPSSYQNDINIYQNTFYNTCCASGGSITLGSLPSQKGNVFANNILCSTPIAIPSKNGIMPPITFQGNMVWGNDSNAIRVLDNCMNIIQNPNIAIDVSGGSGICQLSMRSPAIGRATISLNNIVHIPVSFTCLQTTLNTKLDTYANLDITGASRPQQHTIGCMEYHTNTNTNNNTSQNIPLSITTPSVGPSYM